MTPGLAGFIADSDDPQTWDDITSTVLAALAGEFDVVPERGGTGAGTRRTTWLDTFDWRLHKAGLTLEYVPRRGGSELRLSGAGASARRRTRTRTRARPRRSWSLAGKRPVRTCSPRWRVARSAPASPALSRRVRSSPSPPPAP